MKIILAATMICLAALTAVQPVAAEQPAPEDVATAETAIIYGYPMVMNYAAIYEFFIDSTSSQYKCGFNEVFNTAHVATPADTAVVTPNSDTPYSFFCADLRAEPIVFAVPPMQENRYFSVQLIDLYTYNYGYVGSRTTGNDGGKYMVAGPSWTGEKPPGVDKVFRCETDFSMAIIRTQLFNPEDIDQVKKIQKGYQILPLSTFLGEPAPESPPQVNWPKIDKQLAVKDPYAYLAFLLRYCPTVGPAEVEKPLRAELMNIGIEAGKPFPCCELTEGQKVALKLGGEKGLAAIKAKVATIGSEMNSWRVTAAFGDRDFFNGDWTLRAAAAMAGLYGNDAEEATYPLTVEDIDGHPLDGSKQKYTLTFAAGELPPVNAFWSVTIYDGKTQLLIENPIDRYLINSPMLPELKKNADGSLTIYIQKDSPGKEKESNWLPAPDGPIYLVMRLYWPKTEPPSILPPGQGSWKPPGVVQAN